MDNKFVIIDKNGQERILDDKKIIINAKGKNNVLKIYEPYFIQNKLSITMQSVSKSKILQYCNMYGILTGEGKRI